MKSFKKQFLLLLFLCLSLSALYGQKSDRDYELLNKLFPEIIKDSSETYFLCEFSIDEKLTYHLHNNMNYMAGQLALSDEFNHYTSKGLQKKLVTGNGTVIK